MDKIDALNTNCERGRLLRSFKQYLNIKSIIFINSLIVSTITITTLINLCTIPSKVAVFWHAYSYFNFKFPWTKLFAILHKLVRQQVNSQNRAHGNNKKRYWTEKQKYLLTYETRNFCLLIINEFLPIKNRDHIRFRFRLASLAKSRQDVLR